MASKNQKPHKEREIDEEELTAGLRNISLRKEKNRANNTVSNVKIEIDKEHSIELGDVPLRTAEMALKQCLKRAIERYGDSLAYIDAKILKAINNAQFNTSFTLGEVEGLSSGAHKEYLAFIQLLDVFGYNAKYEQTDEEKEKKGKVIWTPSTVIILDCLPRKK